MKARGNPKQSENPKFKQETSYKSPWCQTIMDGLSPKFLEATSALRNHFSSQPQPQTWFYGGSYTDVAPLLFTPSGSDIHFVDKAYHPDDLFYREETAGQIRGLIASVTKLQDENNERLAFRDGTTLSLRAEDLHSKEVAPEQIDVYYRNSASPTWSVNLLENLKVGGSLVFLRKIVSPQYGIKSARDNLRYGGSPQLNLEDMGFQHRERFQLPNSFIPAFGRAFSLHLDKLAVLDRFERVRPWTTSEELALKAHSFADRLHICYREILSSAEPENALVKRGYSALKSLAIEYQDFWTQQTTSQPEVTNLKKEIHQLIIKSGVSVPYLASAVGKQNELSPEIIEDRLATIRELWKDSQHPKLDTNFSTRRPT